jgi:putative choline sulfate-utilization transcription factor
MAKPRRTLPLQSLACFEAAGRLSSFTAAAQELSTSQPAVSQRIGQLEEELGVPLFKREHRGVELTPDGRLLYAAVRDSLAGIDDAVARIRTRRNRQVLTVATDFGFATWLMPRLASLREQLPELDVRIVTTQQPFDIRGEPVDIAVAFGAGQWRGCHALLLMPELVVPVCSPAFAARQQLPGDAAQLARQPLLNLESSEPARWLSWDSWFARHGQPATSEARGLTLNNEPLVMRAAIAGQGVALGWVPLVDDLIRTGQLVPAFATPVRTDFGYFLLEPHARRPPAAVKPFSAWMLAECSQALAHSPFC